MREAKGSSASGSPTTAATRGRLSERAWADVRRAARLAREEGVKLCVHGVLVSPVLQKLQHRMIPGRRATHGRQQPAETAVQKQSMPTAVDEASPPALSKRHQRSAERLQEYQEKKRAALVAELVSKGTDSTVAHGIVARDERKRLEQIAARRAAPMEEEADSVEGHPPGTGAAAAQRHPVSPKRARLSLPEAG